MLNCKVLVVLCGVLLLSVASASAELITPTVAGFSNEFTALGRTAAKTVDGSGLWAGTGSATDTHYVLSDTMWNPGGIYTGDYSPWITYDLGGLKDVSTLRVWNYNEYMYPQFGAKDVEVFAGAALETLTSRGTVQLTLPPNAAELPDEITSLSLSGVQYVKLAIKTNWDGAIFDGTGLNNGVDARALTGLAEVRFEGVPEPCSMALLTVGAAALLCYAWRKRK